MESTDDARCAAARSTAADTVTFDLTSPAAHGKRAAARKSAAAHALAIAATGRGVCAVVSDSRSGELERDVAAVTGAHLNAVMLSGAETAQDVRDADVAIRKQEMRLDVTPGAVRLIPVIDSAAGLAALPAILGAVDRHSAVALDIDGLAGDIGLTGAPGAAHERAMWDVAVASRTAGLPWLMWCLSDDAGKRAGLAASAHEMGAGGTCVRSEAEVLGMNALFTLSPDAVAAARRTVEEWDRARSRGRSVFAANGAVVDLRAVRRARTLIDLAEAIDRRERAITR